MKRTFRTEHRNELIDIKNRLDKKVNTMKILGAKLLTLEESVYKHSKDES